MSALWTPLLQSFPHAKASQGRILQDLAQEASAATIAVPLQSLSMLNVAGPDASKFLQGQTSTNFQEVSDTQSRLGAYVSLKGRVIASFRAMQQDESIALITDAALAAVMKERLGKFIVFSKATLSVDESQALIGLAGSQADAILATLLPTLPPTTDAVVHHTDLSVVRLHGDSRYLLRVKAASLASTWSALLAGGAQAAGENAWQLHQIAAGEAQVVSASSELFQPQELNLQLLNGVSYNKGCYTGQEIVARLYFRGKLKQHTQRYLAQSAVLPAPGSPVFHEGKHVGDVVLAAQRNTHNVELLAIARPEHNQELRLGDGGPRLETLPLPYAVPVQE